MINRFHIFSFLTILFLYLIVAIWKYSPVQTSNRNNPITVRDTTTTNFWIHFNEANGLRTNRNYQLASQEYDRALSFNRNHKDALYYAGSSFLLAKEFNEALKRWESLYDLEPNAPRTLLQLGTLYFCMDENNPHFNLVQAASKISGAWELNREETGAPLLLAKISLLQNKLSSANQLLRDVLSSDTSNIEALFLSGYLEWKNGNSEYALHLLSQAKRLQQQLDNSILEGEGNTESGARAMLSEDRFCDKFEMVIDSLLHDSDINQSIFLTFTDHLNNWREEFQIVSEEL